MTEDSHINVGLSAAAAAIVSPAGLINSGVALYLIAARNEWFDRPAWAIAIVIAGLAALVAGFLLDKRRRRPQA